MTWARRVTDSIADGASDGTDADKLVDTPRHHVIPGHTAGHGARPLRPAVVGGAVAGIVAIGLATALLLISPGEPTRISAGPTASSLTVQRQAGMPWSDRQILGLRNKAPELGALAGADRLRSCLQRLGYSPTTPVLGAATLTARDQPQVLLLLPGTDRGSLLALVVSAGCGSTDAGLIADAVIHDAAGPSPQSSR
ncbi:hypothetical protein EB75_05555 [Mycobacterium sp. ST-F2]|uniref:hypothetical protein n=1 Tax=Mycobacterium sp. ST-F2 TaxID=1490484 RepID=UPI0009694668|nr:hypothetical protein [Mycobacterium sp. ST-F2]OKH84252.1 hypothetical protein EB75_05555 [Mycobacterium sp. ST-F2]